MNSQLKGDDKMATYENDSYASKGVGNAGLTLGIIGTALASGVLGGGNLGGLFNNNQSGAIAEKNMEIAQLRAEKYSDNKFFALSEKVSNLEGRVLTIEKTEPLRDQIIGERVANLQAVLNGIAKPFVPNWAVAPGWGPAFVSPFPPAAPVAQGGTSTPATSSTSNG